MPTDEEHRRVPAEQWTMPRLLVQVLDRHRADTTGRDDEDAKAELARYVENVLPVVSDRVVSEDTTLTDLLAIVDRFPLDGETVEQVLAVSETRFDEDTLARIVAGLATSPAVTEDARRRARAPPLCTPELEAFSGLL